MKRIAWGIYVGMLMLIIVCIFIIPDRKDVIDYPCGDGVCDGYENPVNCNKDCKITYTNTLFCVFTGDKCIYSESWAIIVGIYLIIIIILIFVILKLKRMIR